MGAPLSGKSLGNFEGSTGNATSEFCVINSDSGRRIGDRMTFRESARDTDPGATAVAPGGLITADEPETPGALGEEAEERSEEHTSELQSPCNLVCRLLLEKKKKTNRCKR